MKTIRNILISIGVLLVLAVGLGVGYTWYTGQQSNVVNEKSAEDVTSVQPVAKPVQIDPNAPESASIQALTTPTSPGENSSVTVKTNPASECSITVTYNDVASKDSGLVKRIADEYGIVSWAWTVDANAPSGKWPVKVTCTYNKKSAYVQGELQVTQ